MDSSACTVQLYVSTGSKPQLTGVGGVGVSYCFTARPHCSQCIPQ